MLLSAKKVRIEWLQKGAVVRKDDMQYVILPFGVRVFRANIIATAVELQASEDGSLCSVILDDGTDTIPARFFGENFSISDSIKVGDILTVLGDVREIEGERCILPYIARAVENPNFELLRELELRAIEKECTEQKRLFDEIRKAVPENEFASEARKAGISEEAVSAMLEYDSAARNNAPVVEEKLVDLRESVMQKIGELDSGSGTPYEKIVEAFNTHDPTEVERALGELLNSGELYEPTAGIYKRL